MQFNKYIIQNLKIAVY